MIKATNTSWLSPVPGARDDRGGVVERASAGSESGSDSGMGVLWGC
ncbi:MAG TPA: hypothetical protein VLT33_20055 [Labilithrix sp.]|nr:hypothetical protein [Labilithrix sp.]